MNTPRGTVNDAADAAEHASEWCIRLSEGEVTPRRRQELEAWLAADERNARAFEDALRVWQAFGQAQSSDAMTSVRDETRRRFEAAQREHRSRVAKRSWLGALAASVMAAVIGVGFWMQSAPESYVTAGHRNVVTLKDGSIISMDAATRVDVRYRNDRRELQLKQGRAKFSVAHDASRPFSVMAADRKVVATGTQFSVELLAEKIQVILYEGSVDVIAEMERSVAGASTGSATTKLAPGQQLTALVGARREARVQKVDLESSLAWEVGQLAFDDEPLSVAIERMNRYTNTPMSVEDREAARVAISGTFFAGDTESFIEGVTSLFPVRVETVDGRPRFISTQ